MKNKIIKGKILEDRFGQFIPVCDYKPHPGIIRPYNIQLCEKRGCIHYVKYRKS